MIGLKVVILGHIQRGGAPSARDRILACKLGVAAVEALIKVKFIVMVGEVLGGRNVLLVASTDLSHYYPYEVAYQLIQIYGGGKVSVFEGRERKEKQRFIEFVNEFGKGKILKVDAHLLKLLYREINNIVEKKKVCS